MSWVSGERGRWCMSWVSGERGRWCMSCVSGEREEMVHELGEW